jgi:hypothetical protein
MPKKVFILLHEDTMATPAPRSAASRIWKNTLAEPGSRYGSGVKCILFSPI